MEATTYESWDEYEDRLSAAVVSAVEALPAVLAALAEIIGRRAIVAARVAHDGVSVQVRDGLLALAASGHIRSVRESSGGDIAICRALVAGYDIEVFGRVDGNLVAALLASVAATAGGAQ